MEIAGDNSAAMDLICRCSHCLLIKSMKLSLEAQHADGLSFFPPFFSLSFIKRSALLNSRAALFSPAVDLERGLQ